jgi:hypothetical protein
MMASINSRFLESVELCEFCSDVSVLFDLQESMSLALIVFGYLMIGCCVFRVLRRVLEALFEFLSTVEQTTSSRKVIH